MPRLPLPITDGGMGKLVRKATVEKTTMGHTQRQGGGTTSDGVLTLNDWEVLKGITMCYLSGNYPTHDFRFIILRDEIARGLCPT